MAQQKEQAPLRNPLEEEAPFPSPLGQELATRVGRQEAGSFMCKTMQSKAKQSKPQTRGAADRAEEFSRAFPEKHFIKWIHS